jgi:outer membrane protein assembly factor BamB
MSAISLPRQWARAIAVALMMAFATVPALAQSIVTYHRSADRAGLFVVPALTWQHARSLKLDATFRFSGNLFAQPLYWRPPGATSGRLIVATEGDTVTAIDAATGNTIWSRSLGQPVPRSSLPCGNIDPLGITGTPVIDEAIAAVYLDAVVRDGGGVHHLLFALSLNDGAVVQGWPIDVAAALQATTEGFVAREQNQRGALLIQNGTLYVPYGGHYGDCGTYHGWVVGVPLADPHRVFAWRTRGKGGGIWAPGGIVGDGQSLFVATGNTLGATQWSDGEAVFRLAQDLGHSMASTDYFATQDWQRLDARDADLGGANPMLLEVANGSAIQHLILALGKDTRAYLLDRNNLGGIGGSLVVETVARYPIRTAPAAYPASDGEFVAFQGPGANCPAPQRGNGLTVLNIRSGTPPTINTAWCAPLDGAGSPMVTTTDGRANPIVWVLGAEGDNRLHGFRGDTGEAIFTSDRLAGLRHFATLIAADGRLYVGADGQIYGFTVTPQSVPR